MKIAVVGATGLVGEEMMKVLHERKFPVTELIAVASERSVGKKVKFGDKDVTITSIEKAVACQPDIALFSAGSAVSLQWAPVFEKAGTTVIDNSSAWRMDSGKKLVVPEINGDVITSSDKIIANPNCSTIQMVMILYPLHKQFDISRVVVSTYQSVSGTGQGAITQLLNERSSSPGKMVYPYPIDLNCLPHIDTFLDNGYTREEMKMVNETKKIMRAPSLSVTATAVRVPVLGGHSESVNITFRKDFTLPDVYKLLNAMPGIKILDNPSENVYPMPLFVRNNNDVLVGRIRRDESMPCSLNCWIVADNLRKGAATNAVQIAELLLKNKFIR